MAKANKSPAHLGEVEQLVVLALLRLGENAYGVLVREEISRRTGRALTLGSVYKTLLRLEDKEFIAARQGEPTPERGGRRKTHYSVLPAGRRALQYSLAALRRMALGLDPVWEAP
jgi:PadR family transcriptional regulator